MKRTAIHKHINGFLPMKLDQAKNPIIAEIAVRFCRFWRFRLGLRGAGLLIRFLRKLYPDLQRFSLEYPGLGRCNIQFLDFAWIRQVTAGLNEEEALIKNLALLAESNPIIWDVGANSGYLAAEILLKLKPSRLDLFEPNLVHRLTLDSLAALDPRIQAHMVGLSDHSENQILHVPSEDGEGATRATLRADNLASAKSVRQIEINLERGDTVVATGDAPPPDILIIDVEGHEAEVIEGMKSTIQKKRPLIALEHLFLDDKVLLGMVPQGYELYTVCDVTARLLRGLVREKGHNSIMIPQKMPIPKKG